VSLALGLGAAVSGMATQQQACLYSFQCGGSHGSAVECRACAQQSQMQQVTGSQQCTSAREMRATQQQQQGAAGWHVPRGHALGSRVKQGRLSPAVAGCDCCCGCSAAGTGPADPSAAWTHSTGGSLCAYTSPTWSQFAGTYSQQQPQSPGLQLGQAMHVQRYLEHCGISGSSLHSRASTGAFRGSHVKRHQLWLCGLVPVRGLCGRIVAAGSSARTGGRGCPGCVRRAAALVCGGAACQQSGASS
jgi:hypothetical protein